MLKKILPVFLIGLSITTFPIDAINAFRNYNYKVLTFQESIESIKYQATARELC